MKIVSLIALVPALLVCACQEPKPEPVKNYKYSCTDPVDRHAFVLETAKIHDRVTVLFGEGYGYFTEPNGQMHRVSESWAWQNCKIPDAILRHQHDG